MEGQAQVDRNRAQTLAMRALLIAVMVGTTLMSAAKDKVPETIDQLKTRVASADKSKKAEIYVELANRQLESANDVYNSNTEQARDLFLESATSAELASKSAIDANHKLK